MSQGVQLARITPVPRPVFTTDRGMGRSLTPREKAAVVVRYLLAEGTALQLTQLPETVQAALAEQMGAMRLVDRQTLDAVVDEFLSELEAVGLAFPGGLEGALNAMDGHISQATASRLRRKAGVGAKGDPWDRLTALSPEKLLPVIEAEGVEVAAVILSKLAVSRAAEILNLLPGPRARRIAFAVSQTGNVDPETVRRIGIAVLAQIDAQPARAFERGPVERVGAILNVSAAATREAVLEGLAEEDLGFAEQVRKAIFTYAHIALRVTARDVPKIIRLLDQPSLVTAMAYSQGRAALEPTTDFLLASISQRMAQTLRDEILARGRVKDKDGEAAMALIVSIVRQLEAAGELVMLIEGEEEA